MKTLILHLFFSICFIAITKAQTFNKPGSGNAISFTDNIKYIEVDGIQLNNKSFTIDFWKKRDPTGGPDFAFGQGITNTNQCLTIGYFSYENFYFGFYGNDLIIPENPNLLENYKWHHYACVYDINISSPSNNRFVYKDGILLGQDRTNSSFQGTGKLNIGSWIQGNVDSDILGLDGSLDEVRIWNSALSQSQIRDRMCRKIINSDPLYSNLLAYYNFDETDGSIAFDGTANGYNGILINSPTRATSGAPIGNASSHDYVNATKNTSLSHSNGESFTVTNSTGNPNGLQVYRVDEQPNTLTGSIGVGSNNKYFGVFQVNGTSPTYQAVYNYTGNGGVNTSNEPSLALFKRNDNASTSWANASATLNSTANTLTCTGQSTEYILGSIGGVLPLTLLSYTGNLQNYNVLLQWQTSNEINTQHFELERSVNGTNFEKIGIVNANNRAGNNTYNFTDANLIKDVYYYRLKMMDNNGTFRYSNIIRLSNHQINLLSVYPNPAKDVLTVSGLNGKGTLQLKDMQGKLLQTTTVTGQSQTLNLSLYASGQYILQYTTQQENKTIKIRKQ